MAVLKIKRSNRLQSICRHSNVILPSCILMRENTNSITKYFSVTKPSRFYLSETLGMYSKEPCDSWHEPAFLLSQHISGNVPQLHEVWKQDEWVHILCADFLGSSKIMCFNSHLLPETPQIHCLLDFFKLILVFYAFRKLLVFPKFLQHPHSIT